MNPVRTGPAAGAGDGGRLWQFHHRRHATAFDPVHGQPEGAPPGGTGRAPPARTGPPRCASHRCRPHPARLCAAHARPERGNGAGTGRCHGGDRRTHRRARGLRQRADHADAGGLQPSPSAGEAGDQQRTEPRPGARIRPWRAGPGAGQTASQHASGRALPA
ncbi:hypothetical protein G6F31_018289 [Rhizopus arrhizus]|nr:hypothetical protein G6F31_018289 [Rhizopus arrhizus]